MARLKKRKNIGRCESCGLEGRLGSELFTYNVAEKTVMLLCTPETGRKCARHETKAHQAR